MARLRASRRERTVRSREGREGEKERDEGGKKEKERKTERKEPTVQLVTDSAGNVSSQFVLLIGGLAQFAHFKVYLF